MCDRGDITTSCVHTHVVVVDVLFLRLLNTFYEM